MAKSSRTASSKDCRNDRNKSRYGLSWLIPVHTLPFPSFRRRGFPQPGRILHSPEVPVPKSCCWRISDLNEGKERKKKRDSGRNRHLPKAATNPAVRLSMISPESPFRDAPAAFAGEVPRSNRDTAIARNANVVRFRSRLPFSNGFLLCSQARIGADQQSLSA